MAGARRISGTLLSREWRDGDDGVEIVLWARAREGPLRARLSRQEAVMFVPRGAPARADRRVARPLATLQGEEVDVLYFRSQRALVAERDRIRAQMGQVFESDVKPSDRYVMERFVTGSLAVEGPARERRGVLYFENPRVTRVEPPAEVDVELSMLALDIETEGLGGALLSAAIASRDRELVIVRGSEVPSVPPYVVFAADERALLVRLFEEIVRCDPDVLCGWNVTEFDLTTLDARARELGLAFAIGRGGERARVLAGSAPGRASIARVPGRVVLDGIATLKSATYSFERFTLEHVSQELLGRGKKLPDRGEDESPTRSKASGANDRVAEIVRLHREDVAMLAEYNLEDCRLVLDIFERAALLGFAVERARLTGLPMDRPGGSVAAFDHLYLPRLHRRGIVAPDVAVEIDVPPSPGGHVLDSVPGLYRDVLSFDFRSLYPSIIRTFQIDPLALHQPSEDPIHGEDGATFARTGAILPELVATLHEARSRAIASENVALSRAIKILMNSFYGVLGTPGCRFFDPRLPTSITRRGHAIIERARAFFESEGFAVIYGDTDSLFVHAEHVASGKPLADRARDLAAELTRKVADEIARDYRLKSHLELRFDAHYRRFLMPKLRGSERGSKKRYAGTVEKPDGAVSLVVRGLEAVRRDWSPLARKVQLELLRRVFADEEVEAWLRGVVEDVLRGRKDDELARERPIDYELYVEKQLAPVCDVVLALLDTSFERIAGAQTTLF